MKSYERNGFDEYYFIAEPTACDACRQLDNGKPIRVSNMQVGYNAPPLHPNCRCSTCAAAESDEEYDKWFYETTGKHSAQWEMDNGTAAEDVKSAQVEYKLANVRNKARVAAKNLIKQAKIHEPTITKTLKEAVNQ